MRYAKFFLIPITLLFVISCSGNSTDPITPINSPESPSMAQSAETSRILLGMFGIEIDAETLTATPVPMRNAEGHRNITWLLTPPECDDCIDITVNDIDWINHVLDVDMTIRNPHWADVYDVRAIVYDTGDGYLLTNWEGWSLQWDKPGGDNINPFRAYAKSEPQRIFESDEKHAENFIISFPDPPGGWEISFAIDCSWPDNCEEPYLIDNYQQIGTLYNYIGSSCKFEIDVYDWEDNVNQVFMQFALINGEAFEMFTHKGGNTWECTLVNNQGLAAPGEYLIRFMANSDPHLKAMFNKFVVTITEAVPDGITEITPPDLNFSPHGIFVDGKAVWVTGNVNGLHLFGWDGANSLDWYSKWDTMGGAQYVTIDNGYAFVTLNYDGLEIFDVDPVPGTHSVGYVDTPGSAKCVAVKGLFAYVGDYNEGIQIIDISTIANPVIVNNVSSGSGAVIDVEIAGDYLICANFNNGTEIFDISHAPAANYVMTVPTAYGGALNAYIDGDYAYMATHNGMQMIDISHPENAFELHNFLTPEIVMDVYVENGYAYAMESDGTLNIYDVDPPMGAHFLTSTSTGLYGLRLHGHNGYVFHAEQYAGVKIIDCRIPGSPAIVNETWTPGVVRSVRNYHDHAYCSLSMGGLQFLDVSNPSAPIIEKTVQPHQIEFAMVDDGYAYAVGSFSEYFSSIDINPLASAHVAWSTATGHVPTCVAISGDYAYVTMSSTGLMEIFDISDPESLVSVNTIATSTLGGGVTIDGHYAYWADGLGLKIIDITDPATAVIDVSIVTDGFSNKVVVRNGYAYVTDGANGLVIIDVDPVLSANIVAWLDTPHVIAFDITLAGGYAYIADSGGFLWIVDIDPLASISTYSSIPITGYGLGINRVDNILYVGAGGGGLRIYELW